MATQNPCYTHKGDSRRNINTHKIVKKKDFVYLRFSTDFLIEEAKM